MSDPSEVVYVSSGAFRTRSVPEIVDTCLRQGITHLELGSGLAWEPGLLERVRGTASRGMSYLVHNYFPPHEHPFVLNLAADDPEALERSRAHCREAVDLTAELGAGFFSVHAGFAFAASPEDLGRDLTRVPRGSLEQAQRTFVESLRILCAEGAARGVAILVENNVVAPFNLVNGKNRLCLCATDAEILETLAEVGAPNLGLLVDVGHLCVSANSLRFDRHRFLDRVAPHVAAFHLSDNDGSADQNRPFGPDAWFLPRLAEFPDATMVLEAYRLSVDEIRSCCDVVADARLKTGMW